MKWPAVLMLLSCIGWVDACNSDSPQADSDQPAPLFYFVKDRNGDKTVQQRTIRLTEHPDLGLIPESTRAEFAADSRQSEAGAVIDLPSLTGQTGMVLVKRNQRTPPDRFRNELRKFQRDDQGGHRRVFRAGAATVVLTNSFTVQFNRPMTEEEVRKVLRGLDFRYSVRQADLTYDGKIIERRPHRWKIEIPNDVAPEVALPQVNRLNESDLVYVAVPDFVAIKLDPWIEHSWIDMRASIWFWRWLKDRLKVNPGPVQPCPPGSGNAPNDEHFADQWYLENTGTLPNGNSAVPGADTKALPAWSVTTASSDVLIAVLDVGIDPKHPDLTDVLIESLDAIGCSTVGGACVDGAGSVTSCQTIGQACPGPQSGDDTHGTQVAGVAAAEADNCIGIAGASRGARLLSIRAATDDPGYGSTVTEAVDALIKAIDLARLRPPTNNDVDILLMALSVLLPDHTLLTDAIRNAISDGITVIISAGNYADGDLDEEQEVFYPASLAAGNDPVIRAGLIAVGATSHTDEIVKPAALSGGPVWGSSHGEAVSLTAPGLWMTTTSNADGNSGPYVDYFGGTSGAAPLVAGAAALLLTAHPGATPEQIKRWLQQGADPGNGQTTDGGGNPVCDEYFGAGRLNMKAALEAAQINAPGPACP